MEKISYIELNEFKKCFDNFGTWLMQYNKVKNLFLYEMGHIDSGIETVKILEIEYDILERMFNIILSDKDIRLFWFNNDELNYHKKDVRVAIPKHMSIIADDDRIKKFFRSYKINSLIKNELM